MILSRKRTSYIKYSVIIILVIVVGVVAVNLSLSYFVANKSRDNIFTIGLVRLELDEENYPSDYEDRVLPPKAVIGKDPKITNIGSNDAYVFMKITVPLCEVQKVDEQTKKIDPSGKAYREVFNLISSDSNAVNITAPEGFTVSDIGDFSYDSKWILIKTEEDITNHTHTYLFGYSSVLTTAEDQNETTHLFDKLQLRSILEGELDKDVVQKVSVSAYGVQSDELPESIRVLDNDNISETELKAVFSLYENQEG